MINFKQAIVIVTEQYGITEKELTQPRRGSKWIVKARRELCRILHDEGMSSTDIGRFLNRHHTTVLNLLNKVKK